MKKLFTLLAAVLLTASVLAQSPEKMSYQAVIRNSSDVLVTDTQVGMQISILQDTEDGSPVYVETQTPTTNANGLVSIEIGDGTVLNGDFTTIDWANGPYFIKTETDPAGSTDYTITGASQLLSVPYALHAKTAENGITAAQADAIAANTAKVSYPANDAIKLAGIAAGAEVNVQADWNATTGDAQILNKPTIPPAADGSETKVTAGTNVTITGSGTTVSPYVVDATGGGSGERYLGEEYLDGIIFYLYIGSDGQQHGLIVSKTETIEIWQNLGLTTDATRSWDGVYNMNLMKDSPAKNWVTSNFSTEWYLPSIDELSILWHNRFHANKGLNDASATLLSNSENYWSSTESGAQYAFYFTFLGGYGSDAYKGSYAAYVRAIRAF